MIHPGAVAAMQQFQLGGLSLCGSYTSSQALSLSRLVWNAEAVDTLNAFSPTSSIVTVPAGFGSAKVWARAA